MSDSEIVDAPVDSDSEAEESTTAHAASLKRLKAKDPDFYEFLKNNDKDLLDFEGSASEDEEFDDRDGEDDEGEDDGESSSQGVVSAQTLAYVKEQIKSAPTIKLCKTLISAFKSSVHQADGSSTKEEMKNSELFNDVIKSCLINLVPALHSVLKLSSAEGTKRVDPSRSKAWKRIQMSVKAYLIAMLKMFSILKDTSALTLLLKHTVHLIPFYGVFIKLSRLLVKKMVSMWCREEETIRVLSLIIIVRTTKTFPKEYLNQVLKVMYFAYIKNTKFTSPMTWPMINFMKRSLTEVYSLRPELAYEHAFIYIRQMSIHLRNALTTKKKESFQTVYNWQYTHCILFWSHLLCQLYEHDPIKSLIYPLVQTTIGAINLIPTARYVPLRFHLIKTLMQISESTGTFIPVLPLILDVLKVIDYNKKSSFSVRPVEFSCALKVTKSQLAEAGFRDACISEVCSLLMSYLKIYCSSIGFSELALPAVILVKKFIKECRVSKYNQQLKSVLTKMEENSLYISEKRRLATFGIADLEHVRKWEETVLSQGTPLQQIKKESVEDKPPKKKRKLSK